MVAVIDYDSGNTASVLNAFQALGEEAVLTNDQEILKRAGRVVLPGVGAFGDAMKRLTKDGLDILIKEIVKSGTPFLGICLGMQLLFEGSAESPDVPGLSLLKGHFQQFLPATDLKVPQIGWNALTFPKKSRLFDGLEAGAHVYFVHSYYLPVQENEDVIAAESIYGIPFGAAVEQGNLMGCQFHPEKSADTGRHILQNFLRA